MGSICLEKVTDSTRFETKKMAVGAGLAGDREKADTAEHARDAPGAPGEEIRCVLFFQLPACGVQRLKVGGGSPSPQA